MAFYFVLFFKHFVCNLFIFTKFWLKYQLFLLSVVAPKGATTLLTLRHQRILVLLPVPVGHVPSNGGPVRIVNSLETSFVESGVSGEE